MSISRYNLAHAYLFYIRCSFLLEESNLVTKVRKIVGLRASPKFNTNV